MKKILFVGSEVMPFAATGGLGDVLGSLPAALAADKENDVRVIMPLYGQIAEEWREKMKEEAVFSVELAWRHLYCGIKSLKKNGVTYYFVDNEYYFKRESLYGSYDDGERFAYFSMAVMEAMGRLNFLPDILHANDWQSALCVVYLATRYKNYPGYEHIRSVFTIHNIEYQGQYHFGILGDVFSLGFEQYDLMNFGGCINLMKAAILCADLVSTVSPRYAEEICTPEYGKGLDGILRDNRGKLCGILNGIDYEYYNPGQDAGIPTKYNWRNPAKKAENKIALQKEIGLPEETGLPLIAVVSRLAKHKGFDLIAEISERLCSENLQFVILGCGEKQYEDYFSELSRRYPDKMKMLLRYDRNLAKRIYAAADIYLMPSRTEPCGLSQMIASRYGAIPVVRETGGLADSIHGYWEDEKGNMQGNGFTFANYNAFELLERTDAAMDLWRDEARRKKFLPIVMRTDFSWEISAKRYAEVYGSLLK